MTLVSRVADLDSGVAVRSVLGFSVQIQIRVFLGSEMFFLSLDGRIQIRIRSGKDG